MLLQYNIIWSCNNYSTMCGIATPYTHSVLEYIDVSIEERIGSLE